MQWRLNDAIEFCELDGTSNLPLCTRKTYDNSAFLIMRTNSERFPTVPAIGERQMSEKILAESSFDLPTSGLWAQHAPTAPLCSPATIGAKVASISWRQQARKAYTHPVYAAHTEPTLYDVLIKGNG